MQDPWTIVSRARQGPVPRTWRVVTKKRGAISGFFRGTSNDPDPLLVLTPEGSVEYINSKKDLVVVNFGELSKIDLRVDGHSFSDSSIVTIRVWVDLYYRNGRKEKWWPPSVGDGVQVVQYFVEAFGAYKALRGAAGR